MISLRESQIVQILPEYFSEEAGVRALSFAVGRAVEKLIDYCKNISVFAVIDELPDLVLDILALELDTQYYNETLSIQAKRALIKNTLIWHTSAGTPAAVEELISIVFGKGQVQEWFQYQGEPYTFRIKTSAEDVGPEMIEIFEKMIQKVKNVRSHLEKISFIRDQKTKVYVAVANIVKKKMLIGWENYGSL